MAVKGEGILHVGPKDRVVEFRMETPSRNGSAPKGSALTVKEATGNSKRVFVPSKVIMDSGSDDSGVRVRRVVFSQKPVADISVGSPS